jgi:hypothetical protein
VLDLHSTPRCRFRALVAAFALWALAPISASAQDVGFALLIENGWSLLNRSFADDRGMVYLGTGGKQVFQVVNGQKGSNPIATANIAAWTRSVPDPYFEPIRPLAGLIIVDFGAFQGHLAIIDTPTGPKTTISILSTGGEVNLGASGAWVFSDGTTVSGGTANDLVVAGVVRFAPYTFVGGPAIDLVPRFPTPPFAYDPTPTATHNILDPFIEMGSFYGAAYAPFDGTPVRGFTTLDAGFTGFGRYAHLLVIKHTGETYFVLACSGTYSGPENIHCTISGTGILTRITGTAFYQIADISIKLALQVYLTF